MGDHIEQMVAHGQDGPRQAAGQLLERRVELGRVRRVDDAQHRLGAGQVDPAREERSQGELARLCVTGATSQAMGQDLAYQGR